MDSIPRGQGADVSTKDSARGAAPASTMHTVPRCPCQGLQQGTLRDKGLLRRLPIPILHEQDAVKENVTGTTSFCSNLEIVNPSRESGC